MFFECFLELLFELSFVLLSKWSLTGNEGGKQGLIYIYLSAFRMPPFPIAFFNSWLVMSHFPVCSAGHVQLTLTVTAVHCTQYTVHSTGQSLVTAGPGHTAQDIHPWPDWQ